jgi:hypothetical protein
VRYMSSRNVSKSGAAGEESECLDTGATCDVSTLLSIVYSSTLEHMSARYVQAMLCKSVAACSYHNSGWGLAHAAAAAHTRRAAS